MTKDDVMKYQGGGDEEEGGGGEVRGRGVLPD